MGVQKKMTKKVLLAKASGLGLKGVSRLKKHDLIHAIQTAEGNEPCFGKIKPCGELKCAFAAECQA